MKRFQHKPIYYMFLLLLLTALVTTNMGVSNSYAFKLQEEGHDGITQKGMKDIMRVVNGETIKFTEEAIDEVISANHDTDNYSLWGLIPFTEHLHFDNESLYKGSKRLIDIRKEIIDALDPPSGRPDGVEARERLGNALHTLQDFYAHSNWLEMNNAGNAPNIHFGYDQLPSPPKTAKVCTGGDTLTDTGLNTLTTGYFSLAVAPNLAWISSGKCLHGLFPYPGIAKDDPDPVDNPLFELAFNTAAQATERYIEDILNDPRVANNPEAIRAFMGVSGSMIIVIDVTTSMQQELGIVKSVVTNMVNSRRGTTEEPSEYVLVSFGDPLSVGTVVVTSDPDYFLNEVNGLELVGGNNFDCPEYSFNGVLDALLASKGGGSMFVFTDANPKDVELEPLIIQKANENETTIRFFVMSDNCSSTPVDPAYGRITQATLGQIFKATAANLNGAEHVIAPQLAGNVSPIQSEYGTFPSTREGHNERALAIPVEANVDRVTFSVAVDSVLSSVRVERPSGEIVLVTDADAEIAEFSSGAVISIETPERGDWAFYFDGSGNYSALVTGNSPIRLIDFSFKENVFNRHGDQIAVNGQPLANQVYSVEARLTGEVSSATFDLFSPEGSIIQSATLTEDANSSISGKYYGTIQIPNEPFLVKVSGSDSDGNNFQRVYPTLYQPQTVEVRLDVEASLEGITDFNLNQTNTFVFTVHNADDSATFDFSSTDNLGFVSNPTPASLYIAGGMTGTVSVDVILPLQIDNRTESINMSVSATNRSNENQRNSMNLQLFLPPPLASIYLPLVTYEQVAPSQSFGGVITDDGPPLSGTLVEMRFYNGSAWSTYDTVYTDSNGAYQFSSLPNLEVNQQFYVRWINNTNNSNRLASWICLAVTSDTLDSDDLSCHFDVDNIDLLSPNSSSTVTLPQTFTWNPRNTITDNYLFMLADVSDFNPSGYANVGNAGSFTLSGLPSGFSSGVPYGWWVRAENTDGYGSSYYYRQVTFSAIRQHESPELLPLNELSSQAYEDGVVYSLREH